MQSYQLTGNVKHKDYIKFLEYVMLHMKTRFIGIYHMYCTCVMKQTGPTQPSHIE